MFYEKADNYFYFGIMPNLSSLFTFQGFHLILCLELCVERAQAPGLASTGIFSFFLSVFKRCFALLILSGRLEHKSSESSFILMSQVLDLLKREYWNGIELATFQDPCIYSCLWCRSGIGKLVFPHMLDSSLAFFHFTVLMEKPCLSPVTL